MLLLSIVVVLVVVVVLMAKRIRENSKYILESLGGPS
jgi:hypothetical protein